MIHGIIHGMIRGLHVHIIGIHINHSQKNKF